MSTRKLLPSAGVRAVAIATIAALALPVIEPTAALAAPKWADPSAKLSAQHEITDFSARRRHHVRRYRGNGGAAAAAAFVGLVGTIGAIAAAQAERDAYESRYRYYYGPGYYGPPPGYYYGGGPGWGYPHRHWHYRW